MKNNIANSFTFSGTIVNIEKIGKDGKGRMLFIEQDVSGHPTTFNLIIPTAAFSGIDKEKLPALEKGDIILVENAYCYEIDGVRKERIDHIDQIQVLFSMKQTLSLGSVEAKELFSK